MRTRAILAAVLGVLVAATARGQEDLSVTKVTLRRNTSGHGDNSVVRLQGFFVTAPPLDVFDPTHGVTLHLKDLGPSIPSGEATDLTKTWLDTECTTANGRTKCYAGGKKYVSIILKPYQGHSEAFSVVAKIRGQNLTGPFEGPLELTLTENGSAVDRIGTIVDCLLKITGLTCRVF